MDRLSITEVREELADIVNRVAYGGDRVLLCRRDKPLVALVSIDDLALLEELEDRMDVAAAEEALAEEDEPISYDDLRKALELD